ncbi:MAG: nucleotide exchange factor GrpE [Clostridia bacterium]
MTKSKEDKKTADIEEKVIKEKDAEAKTSEPAEKTETVADNGLQKMNDELIDSLKRLAAEYDNFRKRTTKEKEDIYNVCLIDITEKFLPVLDNLELALANKKATQDEVQKGIEMIRKQFEDTLSKLCIKEMDCLNKQFDPEFHNAVMTVEDATKAKGTIVEVFKKGYVYKDRVVRHSMVKVVG